MTVRYYDCRAAHRSPHMSNTTKASITIYLPAELLKPATKAAEVSGQSRNKWIVELIRKHLESQGYVTTVSK